MAVTVEQDAGSHDAGAPERPGRHRQEFARRGLRVRREHAHRQALARARLLISNGTQVFAEGKTGEDGVFQHACQELKDAGDVRVFAIDGANVASNVVGLEGVGVALGLADKGYSTPTGRPTERATWSTCEAASAPSRATRTRSRRARNTRSRCSTAATGSSASRK